MSQIDRTPLRPLQLSALVQPAQPLVNQSPDPSLNTLAFSVSKAPPQTGMELLLRQQFPQRFPQQHCSLKDLQNLANSIGNQSKTLAARRRNPQAAGLVRLHLGTTESLAASEQDLAQLEQQFFAQAFNQPLTAQIMFSAIKNIARLHTTGSPELQQLIDNMSQTETAKLKSILTGLPAKHQQLNEYNIQRYGHQINFSTEYRLVALQAIANREPDTAMSANLSVNTQPINKA